MQISRVQILLPKLLPKKTGQKCRATFEEDFKYRCREENCTNKKFIENEVKVVTAFSISYALVGSFSERLFFLVCIEAAAEGKICKGLE